MRSAFAWLWAHDRGTCLDWSCAREMALAGIGLVVGLLVSVALTRLMSSLLYGVSATDFETFVWISLLLTLVVALACYLPARRATRVDPMLALKYE
jgi:putative ABC transport system permease protein